MWLKPGAYFESALRFQPENSTVLVYYSALLVRTGTRRRRSPMPSEQ